MKNEDFLLGMITRSRQAWIQALGRDAEPRSTFFRIANDLITNERLSVETAETLSLIGLLFGAKRCARNDREPTTAATRLLTLANEVASP